MVKQLIKGVLGRVAPHWYDSFMAKRENRYGQDFLAKQGVPAILAALTERYGTKVLGGPFEGMAYITRAAGSAALPKLVGSYERELDDALAQILATRYETVVDVGSAEGFYAVGLAMRLPGSPKVYAFDINTEAQMLCRELATKNNVQDKVVVEGFCDATRLQSTLLGRSLVVCDCEGYETELLQPEVAPVLNKADILVELHDVLKPGITPLLTARFQATHRIQMMDSVERNPADYPVIGFLPEAQQYVAVSEFRHGIQQWAFMTPKAT